MFLRIWIVFLLFNNIIALSFNQPRFYPKATIFANQSTGSHWSYSIFVNSKNSIYILNRDTSEIHIWQNESSINPSKTISNSLSDSLSIFVTMNDDIYVDNGRNGHVDKKWSNGTTTTVAGTGVQGPLLHMLNYPQGIFVDTNFDLYVADFGNGRIQLFGLNQSNRVTVAGQGSSKPTIELIHPTGIILDEGNNCIIGSDENGFRCILGCSDQLSTNGKLWAPNSMSFDSYGNIYVVDQNNNRIQKIIKNSIYDTKKQKLVQTKYLANLTTDSYQCSHRFVYKLLHFYCEIIEIHTIREGFYTITSNNTVDIAVYVYENNFTLFDLKINAIQLNYKNQFKITLHHQMNTSCILIVTTKEEDGQGIFSITVNGPSKVSMRRRNDIKSIIESNYSSELPQDSSKYSREYCKSLDYYYESIQINVIQSGNYTLSSISELDTYGYLYKQHFNPYSFSERLLFMFVLAN